MKAIQSSFLESADQFTGLRPKAWVCVGSGYSREEIKSLILSFNPRAGLIQEAITTLAEICQRLLKIRDEGQPPVRILGPMARQEGLKLLLADRRLSSQMPELKRRRRQRGFFSKLDQTFQSARMSFAHFEEERVFSDYLEKTVGPSPVRDELRVLSVAYEAWLKALGFRDLPLLIRDTVDFLEFLGEEARELPRGLFPERIVILSLRAPEGLEQQFWQRLQAHTQISRENLQVQSLQPRFSWESWHTLDDAAERLGEILSQRKAWDQDAVLFPDTHGARRSLKRALSFHGIPEVDPRDPSRLAWDETIKAAILPLEVVGRGFEREKVISWLRCFQNQPQFSAWVDEINARGIRKSLSSYQGGFLSGVHSRLSELNEVLGGGRGGGRKTCADLAQAHLKILRLSTAPSERRETLEFFTNFWKAFQEDLRAIGQEVLRAPLLYWLERVQERLRETPAPVERLKQENGLRTFRLSQGPLVSAERVFVLGLSPQWFSGEDSGDYWFSEREREILASEFSVRSSLQNRAERQATLKAWLGSANEVVILDPVYSAEGRELESPSPYLIEVARELGSEFPKSPQERGAHHRWDRSFGVLRPIPPQEVFLPALPLQADGSAPSITATSLDHYSRCGFQGLALHRWRLIDQREPEIQPWSESLGSILHHAVKVLLQSRDGNGHFHRQVHEALDQAWKLHPPKGLLRGRRTEAYARAKLLSALEVFCEKEMEYFERARAQTRSLDDTSLRYELPEATIVGTPDRIDETADGIFIMDYKTSGKIPSGTDMIELGYRLQLPFYALAARKELGKEALGVQFIQLDPRGGRSNGIFFPQYNGKESGRLTKVRSNSKSLISTLTPKEAWQRLESRVAVETRDFVQGRFVARPKLSPEKECKQCFISDFCGWRRKGEDD